MLFLHFDGFTTHQLTGHGFTMSKLKTKKTRDTTINGSSQQDPSVQALNPNAEPTENRPHKRENQQ
jgi:hypothetical protein